MKKFQVYVISGDRKTFTNIGGIISAKTGTAAIKIQKQTNEAPASMGRATWRAEEIK
jgi:hypothetical protein